MSQVFIEDFEGGTPGQEVTGFTALAGELLIYTSAGDAAAQSNVATLLQYDSFGGTADVRARTKVKFAAPATGDWWVSVVILINEDNYYEARLRTNNNSLPQISIRKMVGGSESEVLAETDGPVLATSFVTLELYRSGSTLRLLIDDTQYGADQSDDALTGNWRVGYRYQYYSSGAWVVDELEAIDFSSEPSATGRILQVGTESFDQDGMAAANIQLVRNEISYLGARELVFREYCAHTAARFRPEQEVRLLDGNPRECDFRGLIKRVRKVADGASGDAVEYTCYGPRFQAKYVTIQHPTTKAMSIVWNAPIDDEDYDSDFSGKTVGQIITWYIDQFSEQLRTQKAAPNGAIYNASDFSSMTVKPTKLNLRGDFETVILTLLAYQADYVWIVDHLAGTWRFVDWTSHTAKDLSFTSLTTPMNEVDDDSTRPYTAVRVVSIQQKKVPFRVSTEDGSVTPHWDKSLEKYWSPVSAERSRMTCTISEVLAESQVDLALSYSKDKVYANEWQGTTFRLTSGPGLGDIYTIASNSASVDGKFTVTIEGTWDADPLPGNSCEVTDDSQYATTENWNGLKRVFRAFRMPDSFRQNLFKKPCATAYLVRPLQQGTGQTERKPMQIEYGASPGVIMVGLPVVLNGSLTKSAACDTAGDYEMAQLDVDGEYFEDLVLERRYPSSGWRGTAYSTDQSRWDGGGSPRPEIDWGVMREKVIEDPYYTLEEQGTEMDGLLAAWLSSRCNKPFQGSHTYRATVTDGIDRDFANLQKAVTFSSAVETTGWESGVYIFAHAVTFDYEQNLTVLQLGNEAAFSNPEYERLRDAMIAGAKNGDQERLLKALQDRMECVRDGAVKAGERDSGPICATQVRTQTRTGGGTNVTIIIKKLEKRIEILEKNKEEIEDLIPGLVNPPEEPDDPDGPEGTEGEGDTFYTDPSGVAWTVDQDMNWRAVTIDADGVPILDGNGGMQLGDFGVPEFGPRVHKHVEAYEETIWNGALPEWLLPFTPHTSDPPIVFKREGPTGDYVYQLRDTDYTIGGPFGNVLTFTTPPAAGSAVKFHGETGTYKVRRQCRVRVDFAREVRLDTAVLVDFYAA